jgi:hypothetical protein
VATFGKKRVGPEIRLLFAVVVIAVVVIAVFAAGAAITLCCVSVSVVYYTVTMHDADSFMSSFDIHISTELRLKNTVRS